MNLNEILSMHGYGIYVWPTYFITFFVFGINLLKVLTEKSRIKKIIHHYFSNTNTHE